MRRAQKAASKRNRSKKRKPQEASCDIHMAPAVEESQRVQIGMTVEESHSIHIGMGLEDFRTTTVETHRDVGGETAVKAGDIIHSDDGVYSIRLLAVVKEAVQKVEGSSVAVWKADFTKVCHESLSRVVTRNIIVKVFKT